MADRAMRPNSYTYVLQVCFPLVMSMSATTIMEFTDRVFLSNYSIDAISAVAPSGITAYLFIAFFGGVAGYTQVFIAQYYGAGKHREIGAVLWQGIYFTLFSGIIFWLLSCTAAAPIFSLAGHPPEIVELEITYFNLLCRGAIFHVGANCLAGFFTGRGVTRPVMIFYCIGMAVNIPLDYCLIFGAFGLPELGITGAALATVAAWLITTLLFALLIARPQHIADYGLLTGRRFNAALFRRLLRYGIPGSLQFTLDILAFTLFILLIGRLGRLELAATNIVISINALAFMPSMGVSQGVSAMVGQALGRGDASGARRLTVKAIHLLLVYIVVVDIVFLSFPETILSLFIPASHQGAEYAVILGTGKHLLGIVCGYLLFDALYMVFSGTLKGAGDTRFIMWSTGSISLLFLILPVYFGVTYYHFTVEQAWYCVLAFVIMLFLLTSLRYKQGRWEKMLVIERSRQ